MQLVHVLCKINVDDVASPLIDVLSFNLCFDTTSLAGQVRNLRASSVAAI